MLGTLDVVEAIGPQMDLRTSSCDNPRACERIRQQQMTVLETVHYASQLEVTLDCIDEQSYGTHHSSRRVLRF